nr:putative acetyltransferase [uncultured bacterium]
MEFTITPSREEDLAALPEIERRAWDLFSTHPLTAALVTDEDGPRDFSAAHAAGALWVARDASGTPVGFALAEIVDAHWHLGELDVLPDYGRKGIGTALVRAVLAAARERGDGIVTLTTFREVPWNAPFYERVGFRPLTEDEMSPALCKRIEYEIAHGFPPALRVAMRFG